MAITILGIVGSPRKNSNTEILIRGALEGARETEGVGVETKLILLAEKNIQMCRGCCDICFFGGKPCPIKDDMEKLLDELLRADGYILGTPVYFGGVSGLMRVFMDRTVPFFEKLKHKVAGVISVGDGKFGGQELATQSLRTFCLNHCMILDQKQVSATAAKPGEVAGQPEKIAEAGEMGRSVANLIKQLKTGRALMGA